MRDACVPQEEVNELAKALKKVTNEKVDVDDVKSILKGLGIYFPEEELQEVLTSIPLDNERKVNLKDCLTQLMKMPYFTEVPKKKDLLKALTAIRKNEVTPDDIGSMMQNIGVPLPQDMIQRSLKNVAITEDGKVNLEEFIGNLVNLGFSSLPESSEVDDSNLDTFLGNVKMEMSADKKVNKKNGIKDRRSSIAKGKADLKTLADSVKVTGGEVDLNDLDNVLQNMGIESSPEHLEIEKLLPINGGKVNVNNLDSILGEMRIKLPEKEQKKLTENLLLNGEIIDVDKVDTPLQNMRMNLSEEEIDELTHDLPVGANGKVEFSTWMDTVTTVTAVGKVYQNRLIDGVKSLKGGIVDVAKLDTALQNMGMNLTGIECSDLIKNLPVDGKKTDANDLLNNLGAVGIELPEKEIVRLPQTVPIDGGMVKVNNLDNVLENLGIELNEKEREALAENLPLGANGKIELKNLMEAVEAITGGEVDISEVGDVLENMGVTVTDKEWVELIKNLPVNASGKVYQNRLLDGLKSFKGGKVERSKVNTVLENMGIQLTGEELQSLTDNLPVNDNGKIDLDKLMDGVKTLTGGDIDVGDVGNVLGNMGIELTKKEWLKLLKNLPINEDGKIYQNRLMDGVKSLRGGMVDVNKLDTLLRNMGMSLTEERLKDLTQNLPVNADGKVVMKQVMDAVKAFTGEKIDVDNLENLLRDKGIELTDTEYTKLVTSLPVSANGKVDLKKVMDGVKAVKNDDKIFQNKLLEVVKSLKGGKVNINDLNTILDNMGIKISDKELKPLTQNLPGDDEKIDTNGLKIFLGSKGIELTDQEKEELLKTLPIDGGKVHANNLDNALKKLELELTEKELAKLSRNLQVDANGMVGLKEVMNEVKATTGGEVDVNDVKTILKNMGIEFTDKERLKLLKNLSFNDDNKVFKNRLLDGVKSLKAGEVDMNNLDTVLNNLGIKLADTELKDLPENMHVGVDEKIPLETLMENITDFRGEKIESSDLKNVLENLGIELRDEELEKLLNILPVDDGKVKKNNLHTSLGNMGMGLTEEELVELSEHLQVDANGNVDLHNVMEGIKAITGKVDIKNLETVLSNMGIKPPDQELEDLKENLPISAHGKVFQKRLLKDVMYSKRGKVDVNNLDPVLEAMGVKLTEKELDLLKHLLSASKKVDLKKLMDKVEAVTGEKIDVNDMKTVLGNMGIELTDKELSHLVKNLPVDNGKVYQRRLLDGIKFLKGGKIDSSKVDEVLGNMGMVLTEKELKDVMQNLPVNGKGKVDLEKLMNEVKYFSGDKVDANRLESVFKNLGLELTPNEHLNFLKTLPLDADGKVYKKRLMKGIKSLKRGNVDVNKLDTLLENMGISITEEEFMDLIERLPDDDKGKVQLNTLMEELSSVLGKQIDVSDIDSALKDMNVEVTDKEYFNLVKNLPVDAEGKVYQKRLQDGVKALKRGKVAMNKLVPFLGNMGIKLSHEELEDFSQNLPVDGNGKVDLKNVTMEMKDFTGEKIDVRDLKNILGVMGIEVNDKECLELQKLLPTDDDKRVFQNRLLSALKSFKGGKIDANNLNTVLRNMGIKLKNKEFKNVIQNQPIDADGNVSLKKVMNDVKAVTGEKVNVKDLKNILKDIGIEFTPKEYLELVKNLQVDDDGNIYENRLLDCLRSFNGGKVDVSNLGNVLENMKIKFPDKKLKDLSQNLPTDASGMADLHELLKEIKKFTGGKVEAKDIHKVLGDMGIELTDRELRGLLKTLPITADGKVEKNTLLDHIQAFPGGKYRASKMQGILENLGYELDDEEVEDLQNRLPHDGKLLVPPLGKVSSSNKTSKCIHMGKNRPECALRALPVYSHHRTRSQGACCRVGRRYGLSTQGVGGVHTGQTWGSSSEVLAAAHGQAPLLSLKAVSSNHTRRMLFNIICLFLIFLSPVMEAPPQHLGCCRGETGFSSSVPHSWGSWTATRSSPIPLGRDCHQLV
ncbi:uncharacterized protein LOC120244243 [Hyaena hyaena]|uniref:uncharacterized protein LOC120244243 n=1 Tax=Hyaena hyaena TaxID=95912 RepID=UPI0019235F13|nr:uncharacterized protein LOC120244243 [Hyaena hyaena]